MDKEKTVIVDEETWNKIVEELGYEPENLKMTNYMPKNQAVIIDNEKELTPFFKGYKPKFYFNTDNDK